MVEGQAGTWKSGDVRVSETEALGILEYKYILIEKSSGKLINIEETQRQRIDLRTIVG